ncbi:hypothetical protein BHE90_016373 [Fusarium euwallaceae]|uniref:Gmp synthase n=2 Tax=Fusarium solani species complex TaxID=232080 RepID=A0A428T603_9HYPO|nr:hypothetical protein CEP52_010899 [Fusarium oligoseptatum]RTE69249.1 hypothetical protein BHE90_016373 [Fusarium euwallaceae]
MSTGSKYKDIMKKGWHPEKPGTTIKGQVNGLLHRKKSDDDRSDHVAVPLSRLKDPASFAPPPKRTGSGLAPPPPPPGPRKVITAPSKYMDPRAPAVEEPQYAEPEEEEEPKPRGPYRANTTGLATNHLPKPPGRRDGADGRPAEPPSYQSAMAAVGGGRSAPPSLPPRLPPRTNSGSTVSSGAASPAPSSNPLINQGSLNQGAISRLSAAGVSVPAFGIGRSSPAASEPDAPPKPPRPGVASPPATPSHMNELQNRFSKLGTSNANAAAPPSEGTTWAQKQAALKTASNFQKDPSSVSLSDARAAASTANNFRQRHGEQVAAGANAANNLNQKYGLMDKAKSSYASVQGTQQGQGAQAGPASPSPSLSGIVGKKKPPPPPPKKKPALVASVTPSAPADDDAPPPIPMATRPQF